MVEIIRIIYNEVKSLREIVIKQQNTINDLCNQHKETRSKLQTFKTLMTEKLKQIYNQLDTIRNNPIFNNYINASSNRSYTEIMRTLSNSSPRNIVSISSIETILSTTTDILYYTINIFKMANENF